MNSKWEIVMLRNNATMNERVAEWFYDKWKVPKAAYLESINECQREKKGVPQWYIVLDGDVIIGGLGVIENDFHKRKDLSPNICAVFVLEKYRNQGVAKHMIDYVCKDLSILGYPKVYLITEHTDFYEKCGWEFLCMVEEDNGHLTRMYYHLDC